MDDQELLEKLESLAEGLGYEVRYQPAGGHSGKCVLRGQKVAIVDSQQTVRARVDSLAQILAEEDLERVYLPPELRLLIETYRAGMDEA